MCFYMSQVKVSAKRHLAKSISYRIISTLIGFLIMWAISGSIKIGAAFGVAELIYKPIQYYIHERIWYRWISYGLIKVLPAKQVKIKNPRVFKRTPQLSLPIEPKEIKESEQPPIPEIKRLTYTKKSD